MKDVISFGYVLMQVFCNCCVGLTLTCDLECLCSFLETNVPLLVLVEAARNGNEKEVEEYAQVG